MHLPMNTNVYLGELPRHAISADDPRVKLLQCTSEIAVGDRVTCKCFGSAPNYTYKGCPLSVRDVVGIDMARESKETLS